MKSNNYNLNKVTEFNNYYLNNHNFNNNDKEINKHQIPEITKHVAQITSRFSMEASIDNFEKNIAGLKTIWIPKNTDLGYQNKIQKRNY